MSLPQVVSRDEWLVARRALLAREKELTRVRDALSADRRRLPMVRVEQDYRFEGPEGEVGLVEMFEGRRQLIIQHFMFDPAWDDGCPSCTARFRRELCRPAGASRRARHVVLPPSPVLRLPRSRRTG